MDTKVQFCLLTCLLGITILLFVSCVPGLSLSKSQSYVPVDLDDCLAYLDTTLTPTVIDTLRAWKEEDLSLAHLGLGLWLRNDWGLWHGSRLAKWFNAQGIFHPDDMSGIILTSYWRHLHDVPIQLDSQVASYVAYWYDHTFPDTLACLKCGRKIKGWYMCGPGVDTDHPGTVTQILFCSKKHPSFFSRTHGLYAIDEDRHRGLLDTFNLRSKAF
ncbi:MAG: hypothetical protein IPH75_11835 [bacterium]|nr:hypothetical protein [bacterium]